MDLNELQRESYGAWGEQKHGFKIVLYSTFLMSSHRMYFTPSDATSKLTFNEQEMRELVMKLEWKTSSNETLQEGPPESDPSFLVCRGR